MCILEKDNIGAENTKIPIPREVLGALAIKGLIGKICIVSTWSAWLVRILFACAISIVLLES